MERPEMETRPADEGYRLVGFDRVEVKAGAADGPPTLRVTGTTPCANHEVSLRPRTYAGCPEYWGIEVVAFLPGGLCFTSEGLYDETIPLEGVTGSRGIEIIGQSGTERHEVAGGCTGD